MAAHNITIIDENSHNLCKRIPFRYTSPTDWTIVHDFVGGTNLKWNNIEITQILLFEVQYHETFTVELDLRFAWWNYFEIAH